MERINEIVNLAIDSLVKEAYLYPKPGLVDFFDTGSHNDMDFSLFLKSANSFRPAFTNYFLAGFFHNQSEKNLLKKIRVIGLKAENNMFLATDNINTHKGANFSYGLFISALGYYKKNCYKPFLPLNFTDVVNVFNIIKLMTMDIIKDDFKDLHKKSKLSYGEKLYIEHGFAGIRKEAMDGFPTIMNSALPHIISINNLRQYSKREKYLEVLFLIMSTLDDSNLISRGGFEALIYVKNLSSYFLKMGGTKQKNYLDIIKNYNEKFKLLNISPGGSADLLALTIFLESLLK